MDHQLYRPGPEHKEPNCVAGATNSTGDSYRVICKPDYGVVSGLPSMLHGCLLPGLPGSVEKFREQVEVSCRLYM